MKRIACLLLAVWMLFLSVCANEPIETSSTQLKTQEELLKEFREIISDPDEKLAASSTSGQTEAEALHELGLVTGKGTLKSGKTNYELAATLTRAEAVTLIVRLLGVEKTATGGTFSHPFTDVPDWADAYIGYAYENGIVNGIGADLFGTDVQMTQNAFLTMLLRVMQYKDAADGSGDFKWDDPQPMAVKAGLMKYKTDKADFTRGEAFKLCYKAMTATQKDGKTLILSLVEKDVVDATVARRALGLETLTESSFASAENTYSVSSLSFGTVTFSAKQEGQKVTFAVLSSGEKKIPQITADLYVGISATEAYRFSIDARGNISASRGIGVIYEPCTVKYDSAVSKSETEMETAITLDLEECDLAGREALFMDLAVNYTDLEGKLQRARLSRGRAGDISSWLLFDLEGGTLPALPGDADPLCAYALPKSVLQYNLVWEFNQPNLFWLKKYPFNAVYHEEGYVSFVLDRETVERTSTVVDKKVVDGVTYNRYLMDMSKAVSTELTLNLGGLTVQSGSTPYMLICMRTSGTLPASINVKTFAADRPTYTTYSITLPFFDLEIVFEEEDPKTFRSLDYEDKDSTAENEWHIYAVDFSEHERYGSGDINSITISFYPVSVNPLQKVETVSAASSACDSVSIGASELAIGTSIDIAWIAFVGDRSLMLDYMN